MAPSIQSNITDHAQDILKDDQTGHNPNVVEELLTKEMLQLSFKDRNAIQEEIHGVKCLAVKETPELIEQSLEELTHEIDKNIPDSQKRAYLKSLERNNNKINNNQQNNQRNKQKQQETNATVSPTEIGSSSERTSSTQSSSSPQQSKQSKQSPKNNSSGNGNINTSSYIHEKDFKLRFLRCEFFDAKKAAKRMCTYLDLMVELFGEYALDRPISLSDFTKEELRHMRKGMIQTLPYRDRSGRRIMIAFPEEEQSQIPPFVKAKIAMYMLWSAGSNDTVTQKKGIIVLVWFDASFAKLNRSWKIKYKFYTLNCDRISAIHCCSPDTPHYRFRRSVMTMRAGSENLSKLIFHLGESMEINYKLQGYGIPFEHVPISWTGKVKIQYLKQWMRIRLAIEKHTIHNQHGGKNNNGTSSGSDGSSDESPNPAGDIIECPQLQDVVFRQGTSGVSHPGNVTFRSLIESTVLVEQFEREKQQQQKQEKHRTTSAMAKNNPNNNKTKPKAKRPKQLALEIYEERQRTSSSTGRFLIWNNEKGWWNELNDKEHICMKIEYMVREFQKMASQRSTKQPLQNNKHNSRKNYPCGGTSGGTGSSSNFKTKNVIHLQSGTSLFQSQDGRSPIFTNKRQRLGILGHDANNGGSSTLSFGGKRSSEMECFGMKFTPCLT